MATARARTTPSFLAFLLVAAAVVAAPHRASADPTATAAVAEARSPFDVALERSAMPADIEAALRAAARGKGTLPLTRLTAVTETMLAMPTLDDLHVMLRAITGQKPAITTGHKAAVAILVEHMVSGERRTRPFEVRLAEARVASDADLRAAILADARPGGSIASLANALERLEGTRTILEDRIATMPASDARARLRRYVGALDRVHGELAALRPAMVAAIAAGMGRRRAISVGLGPSIQQPGVVAATHIVTGTYQGGKWSLAKRAQITHPNVVVGPVYREPYDAQGSLFSRLWRLANPRLWKNPGGRQSFLFGTGSNFQVRFGNPQIDTPVGGRTRPTFEGVFVLPGLFAAEMSRDKIGGYVVLPFGSPIGARIEASLRLPIFERATLPTRAAGRYAWSKTPIPVKIGLARAGATVKRAAARFTGRFTAARAAR
jgi:hypothetical protein